MNQADFVIAYKAIVLENVGAWYKLNTHNFVQGMVVEEGSWEFVEESSANWKYTIEVEVIGGQKWRVPRRRAISYEQKKFI